MQLDINSVGKTTQTHECTFDWKTLALYALGIGATENELDYLYEKRGPKAYPSFAMVPNYPVMSELLELCKGPYDQLLHGGQTVTVHSPLPSTGTLKTTGKIKAIHDVRVLAQVILETETRLGDELIYTTEWQMLFRGEGGFGGPRRPKNTVPKVPKRDADWSMKEGIPSQQALLYRLSGDHNPLHADPGFAASVGFEQGPILHGLCTFGYVCRAVALKSCNGDASRIRSLTAQFKNPVWPGDTLTTEGYVEGSTVLLQSFSGKANTTVIAGAAAELSAS